jgi:formylglycine-generating enzyme required for sulfatase activity
MALLFVPLAAADARPITPAFLPIPCGPFIAGSDAAEREAAYRLDEAAYGHGRTREWGWYDRERARGVETLDAFHITRTPITNAQYAAFIEASGHRAPAVDEATWRNYRLNHAYEETLPYQWREGKPPPGKEDHPVVLVAHADARAYAAWLSENTGLAWRLPSELEWEKAARGTEGRRFPWGDEFDPARLNSWDRGPFATMPVASFPEGASPFGLMDAAGQVFEWTATASGQGRYLVKGGSWDDKGCGICRPAARHGRPEGIKHILIGFRLLVEAGGGTQTVDPPQGAP